MREHDNSYDDYVVKEVSDNSDSSVYSISTTDSTGFGLSKEYGVKPVAGDNIRLYVVLGSQVRGLDLNGKSVFYKSDEQLEEERQAWLRNYELEKQEAFAREKMKLNQDYESLPGIFKQRIDKFRAADPKFRVDSESYEMYCCTQAVLIAKGLNTFRTDLSIDERVKLFKDLSFTSVKELIPGLDDGHSGNTFAGSVSLASYYLKSGQFEPDAEIQSKRKMKI